MATASLNPHDLVEFGPFQLFGDGRLLHEGRPVALAPKERAVLRVFVDAGGRVVPKDELLDRAWLTHYQGRRLTVIARDTSRRFGQDARPTEALAREVDAGFVLKGSLARRGGRLVSSVGLVAAQDGERLLARTFERDEGDLRALPSDIAAAVADRLPIQVSSGRDPRLVSADHTTPRVYEAYLEARMLFRVRTAERLRRAIAVYEQAIAWDPRFAPAYVGLADCIGACVFFTAVARDEGLAKMQRLLDEATAIDPETPGLAVLRAALRSAFHWDFAGAEPLFREALERDVADAAGLNSPLLQQTHCTRVKYWLVWPVVPRRSRVARP